MLTCDVLVVGAGIIGNWVAYKLASDGLRTMVVDQGGIAAGTSRASEGNLLVSDRSTQVDAELMLESQRLWSDAIESLGNECEYHRKGSLLVTTREEQIPGLDEHGAMLRAAGASCQVVTSEVREIEPSLGRSVAAALWVPQDAQIP